MAVTLHEGTSFVVCDERGDFEPDGDGGFFHLDTRFLSRRQLRLDGAPPIPLQAMTPHANEALHFLVNPPLQRRERASKSPCAPLSPGIGVSTLSGRSGATGWSVCCAA